MEHLSTISTPGKVLICGGYLVLAKENPGLVLGSSSRFYTSLCWESRACTRLAPSHAAATPSTDVRSHEIVVHSPQFHISYHYSLDWLEASSTRPSWRLRSVDPEQAYNAMIETSVLHSLSFISHLLGWECFSRRWKRSNDNAEEERILAITLRADNDFYSQAEHLRERGLPATLDGLRSLPRFLPCPIREGKVLINKTGLGSSAALVTSLVGGLLHFFNIVDLEASSRPLLPAAHLSSSPVDVAGTTTGAVLTDEQSLPVVHNLSQACHALAQGKVGSGFDVSAAVYGSQVYRRFSIRALEGVMSNAKEGKDEARFDSESSKRLTDCVLDDVVWDCECSPFKLPPGLTVLLGDVAGGSSTPAMVRKVLQWRAEGGASAETAWSSLGRTNDEVRSLFATLCEQATESPAAYQSALSLLTRTSGSKWPVRGEDPVSHTFISLRSFFLQARCSLKSIGEAAGADIEPPSQSELADATMEVPGVLCAAVPGAGGVDAIFAILLCEEARRSVGDLWASWHSSHGGTQRVTPLLATVVSEKHSGIRAEPIEL